MNDVPESSTNERVQVLADELVARSEARPDSCLELSEISELRFVPTRDNPQCPIGYRCREPGFEEWNW